MNRRQLLMNGASLLSFAALPGLVGAPSLVSAFPPWGPAPPGPQTFTLSWDPVFADVSQAGDHCAYELASVTPPLGTVKDIDCVQLTRIACLPGPLTPA